MSMTWKDIKREYLLMLIKEGDLSNTDLHDAIAGVQHMIRRHNSVPMPATIEDMRRIIEKHNGVQRDCPTCKWECEQGNDHPRWDEAWLRDELEKDGACPIWEEHNANPKYALIPDGMSHEKAVKHLAHGPEMVETAKELCGECDGERVELILGISETYTCSGCKVSELLAKLKSKYTHSCDN